MVTVVLIEVDEQSGRDGSCASRRRVGQWAAGDGNVGLESSVERIADAGTNMSLRVIGAGLGRTGTASLKLALDHGFKGSAEGLHICEVDFVGNFLNGFVAVFQQSF